MKRFLVTARARLDLIAICDYLEREAGIATANRVLAHIYDAIQRLVDQPGMGHMRADVSSPNYRFWTVDRHVIAYRTDRTPLTVARVLHGARDFRRLFK